MSATYAARRAELETYFDRTASDAWAKLTSDAPVSGIRATVRAGREEIRNTLLAWLPADLTGRRILDAGCGTGTLAVEAARRGADVVAIDIAKTLVDLAAARHAATPLKGRIEFRVGDMTDAALGTFDHVVAMDSVIHYGAKDISRMLESVLARTRHTALFTIAPRTPLLTALHAVGLLFPHSDRAPAIVPVVGAHLSGLIREGTAGAWTTARTHRVNTGFYISEAMELTRA